MELDETSVLKASLVNDEIELKSFEVTIGKFKTISLIADDPDKFYKIKLLNPDRKARFFDDQLTITTDKENGIKLINLTFIDNYISGVSEAEAGKSAGNEFYKVQSVLARTYALAHLYKHQPEGFNLCDQVHCQAFHGKSTHKTILDAVHATKGEVVVDQNMQLITAAFHSNSGGQTANSEDVWNTSTSYLKSVIDTFSLRMPNAYWQKRIPKQEWLNYLKSKNFPVQKNEAKEFALNFKQEKRLANLEYENVKIPLRTIRTELKLKSTFFDVTTDENEDMVILNGRGFGHGIGMCQEGAILMTKSGYDYKQVLNFYYKNIYIIDLSELHFFKD
jgi:stage II sporulation protein D